MVQHSVKVGTQALERVTERLAMAGVRLPPKKDVAYYSLDSDNPRRDDPQAQREERARGSFVDGVFKAS